MIKGGIGNMLKQVQLMQQNIQKAQAQLAETEVEGVSGAGMVKVILTCRNDVRRVQIDPSAMDDREMLEDLIAAAMNDAVRKAEAITQEKMGALTQGMPLPPGIKDAFLK